MDWSLFYLTAVLAVGCYSFDITNVGDVEICGREPADIVFVLDESSSIHPDDFKKQISFVGEVVKQYDIEKGNIQVGVMTFASDPLIRFHLGTVKTNQTLASELRKITQTTGNTFTADAINLAVTSMFGDHGRQGVAKVMILITDGESENTQRTAEAARNARDQAQIVIFAIGVGKNLRTELELIASSPSDDYVHEVDNYKALEKISKALAYKTCVVTTPEPTTTTTPTTTTKNMIEECTGHKPLDLIFALSDTADEAETATCVNFITMLVSDTKLAADRVQVGVTPRFCQQHLGINLNEHDQVDTFGNVLRQRVASGTYTELHLQYMYQKAILPANGAREEAVKVGLLIIDSKSVNKRQTLQQATLAKDKGMQLIVIAVGDDLDEDEIKNIASGGESLIKVDSYSGLTAKIKDDIKRRLCRSLLDNVTDGDYDYKPNF